MRACWKCKAKIPFLRLFLANPESGTYLACKHCGSELINAHRMLGHLLMTGLFMVAVIIFDEYLPFHRAIVVVIDTLLVVAYFYLFLPFKKQS